MYLNRVYKHQTKTYRVVYEAIDGLWIIELENTNAWPIYVDLEELNNAQENQELEFITDPYTPPAVLNDVVLQKRDEAFKSITPIIIRTPELFDKSVRNKLIQEAVATGSHPRIYYVRYLRKYFQQGMSANALLAKYCNSGGKGKVRRSSGKKVGKKRSLSKGTGVVITDDICRLFELAIEGHYFVRSHTTLANTYIKFLAMYKSNYPEVDAYDVPTEDQFNYFYYKNYAKEHVIKKTTPRKIYDNDIKPLISTSTNMNIGPGGRYEIDATIVDIYTVSELDPEIIVGRPTLYLVKDVFSRMIVGMYLGFENASWVTASMAMINAFCDKVKFCQEFGIDIRTEDWPSVGVPAGLMADKGELMSHQADVLVNALNIQLSNSRSYLGSDKGGVERAFNTIQTAFKPYAEGIVEPVNGKKRLGKRYELDADLNLKQLTRMIIRIILNHNNGRPVKGYDFAKDMPVDLPAVPIQLWNWGIKNRTGKLKYEDEKYIWINLLPQGKGTFSDKGLKFRGLFYTCDQAIRAGWLERTGQTGRPKSVVISFDPRSVNEIYVRFKNDHHNYWICRLSDRSRRYKSLSFSEVNLLKSYAGKSVIQERQRYRFDAVDLQEELENIAAEAQKNKTNLHKVSNSKRLSGIKQNKQNEKKVERQRTVRHQSEGNSNNNQAPVVDINTRKVKENSSFKLPSIDDLLGDDE